MEDALPALLLDLDALPARLDLGRRVGDGVGEDVRVPADELLLDGGAHAGQVAGAALAHHEGEQHDLQQQVAELAVHVLEVVAGDGVGELVDLLDRVGDDVPRRLLAVPRALHAEHVDDALERDELLPEHRVVEGVAGGHGEERRARRRPVAARGDPPAQLPREARTVRPGHGDERVAGSRGRHEPVEPPGVAGVDLQEPALSATGGLRDQVAHLAAEAGGNEDGAAAAQRPQRCCGRQTGGGADEHEREAHGRAAPSVSSRGRAARAGGGRAR